MLAIKRKINEQNVQLNTNSVSYYICEYLRKLGVKKVKLSMIGYYTNTHKNEQGTHDIHYTFCCLSTSGEYSYIVLRETPIVITNGNIHLVIATLAVVSFESLSAANVHFSNILGHFTETRATIEVGAARYIESLFNGYDADEYSDSYKTFRESINLFPMVCYTHDPFEFISDDSPIEYVSKFTGKKYDTKNR